MKNLKFAAVLCALTLLGGCGPTFQSDFESQAKEKHWTREQTLVARYEAYRILCLKKDEDGSYAVNYTCLAKEEVIKQIEKNIADLDDILDYKDKETSKFLKEFGLRDYLVRQEFVMKAVLARVLVDDNNVKFAEYIGESDMFDSTDALGRNSKKGFDQRALTIVDLQKAYPFKSKVVEEARAAGLLKEIGRVMSSVSREMDRKEADPNDLTDPNKFVWVPRKIAYELVQYKVMTPGEQSHNSTPNYVEIWRVVEGKRESLPAARAFLDGYGGAVVILDYEKETEIGFGLPNSVERISEGALYSDGLITRLFPEKKSRRIEPKVPPIRVEIVRAGAPLNEWENCPEADGCRIPTSYKMEPMKDTYNVRISFRMKKPVGSDASSDATKTIEYIAKEWTAGGDYRWSPGQVVEYYKPKAQCNGAILSARVLNLENKKKVQISCQDGTEVVGVVTPKSNIFIVDKPEKISFTVGETRWQVWDSKGDGKFDKRRKVSTVLKHDVGVYPMNADAESGMANPHGSGGDYPELLGGPH